MVGMVVLRGPIQWYASIVNEEAMSWQNAGYCNRSRNLMHLFLQDRNYWECLELSFENMPSGNVPDHELSDVQSERKPQEADPDSIYLPSMSGGSVSLITDGATVYGS